LSLFDNPQYQERKSQIEKQFSQFSTNIPSYQASSSKGKVGILWEKVIGKEVNSADNSADDKDVGKVKSLSADHVEVTEGCTK
jgi:hypothetical protein